MPGKAIRREERLLIIQLFHSGLSCREIADRVDRATSTIRQALTRWGVRSPQTNIPSPYRPTQKRIQAACARYRPGKLPMPILSANLVEILIGADETHDRHSTRLPEQALEARGG